jgi:hypothetical protein
VRDGYALLPGRRDADELPRFDGPRRDLPLNRTPPSRRVAA